MAGYDATLLFGTKLDTKGLVSGMGKAKGSSGKLGSALKTVGKVGVAAFAAAGTAVAGLAYKSLKLYSQYEQLVGGVDTLFKNSSDTVQKYANEAYKTAGMSANQYMETITGFSASLIQSLGGDTAKAAKIGNMAVKDMSDNANKMGTSIDSIQQTYRSLARGSYAMLDNLKLGYGGTKAEMQRLLNDAEKLTGKKFDISNFSDVTQAIHAIQTEMGITGTTSKEASNTIEGSVNMMKASWENLLTGLGSDNADIDKLINQFVDSVYTAGENITPRLEKILTGVAKLITKLAPVVANAMPAFATKVLPAFIKAAVAIVVAIAKALPEIFKGLATALPEIITGIVDAIPEIINAVIAALPEMLVALATAVKEVGKVIVKYLPQILLMIVAFLGWGIPGLIASVVFMILLPKLLAALDKLGAKLKKAGMKLLKWIISGITAGPKLLVKAALFIAKHIVNGLKSAKSLLKKAGKWIVEKFSDAVKGAKSLAHKAGKFIGSKFSDGLKGAKGLAKKAAGVIKNVVIGHLKFASAVFRIGKDIVSGLWNGIKDKAGWLKDKIKGFVGNVKKFLKDLFGIKSPSKWARNEVGAMLAKGLAFGVEDETKFAIEKVGTFGDSVKDAFVTSMSAAEIGGGVTGTISGSGAGSGIGNTTINNDNRVTVEQPVKTPAETARAIRAVQTYGLAGA